MFCMNDYAERFYNTLNKIKKSKLYDFIDLMHINVVGNDKFVYLDPKINLIYSKDSSGEIDTIKYLHKFCNNINENIKILYLHCKGVSHNKDKNVQSWIDYMEYFNIYKWKDCINKLNEYDTCGVNLQEEPVKHYSGNFWWSNSSYIKKLPEFNINNCKVPYCINNPRMYCEFWLLDNNFCKPFTMWNSNINHYHQFYSEKEYINHT